MSPSTAKKDDFHDSPAKGTRSQKAKVDATAAVDEESEAAGSHNSQEEESSDGDNEEDEENGQSNGKSRRERLLELMKGMGDYEEESDEDEDGLDTMMMIQQKKAANATAKVSATKKKKASKPAKKKMTPAQKKAEKKRKEDQKQKLLDAVKNFTLHDVVVTDDGTDVEHIGRLPWSHIPADARYLFCKVNKVQVPHKQRKKDEIGGLIANHIKGSVYKDEVTKPSKKKAKESEMGRRRSMLTSFNLNLHRTNEFPINYITIK